MRYNTSLKFDACIYSAVYKHNCTIQMTRWAFHDYAQLNSGPIDRLFTVGHEGIKIGHYSIVDY